jgi:hypothetical protein
MTPEFKVGDVVERVRDTNWVTYGYPKMQVGDSDTIVSIDSSVHSNQIFGLKKFGPGHSSINLVLAKSLEKKKTGFAKFVSRLEEASKPEGRVSRIDEMTPEYVNRFKS